MTAPATTRSSRLLVQLTQFGLVGAAGFLVDLIVFNSLRMTVLAPEDVHAGPLIAKVVSTVLAILTNWLGNRYWTFSGQRQSNAVREGVEFFAVSVAGMFIGLACLWISHYLLGFTSVLADNIAANVIGLAAGAVFRFVLYRYWVFSPSRQATALARRTAAAGENTAGERAQTPVGVAPTEPA